MLINIIPFIDLTHLDDSENAEIMIDFSRRAQTSYGNVAALCVYPKWLPLLRPLTTCPLATVINFPNPSLSAQEIKAQIKQAILEGADEIDLVFPYVSFFQEKLDHVRETLNTARRACEGKVLKIILETCLYTSDQLKNACILALEEGADFLKTSTGKSKEGATPEAVEIMLKTLQNYNAGLKISGGIRTIDEVQKYFTLIEQYKSKEWITPKHLRIGASTLLDHILKKEGNVTARDY